jgi:hypothetical protein
VKTEALKQMQKKQKVMEANIVSLQASQALNEVESDEMDIVSDKDTFPKKKRSSNPKTLKIKRNKRWSKTKVVCFLLPVRVKISSITEIEKGEAYIDLDSHADTSVLGSNALKVETPYSEQTAIVSFADPSVGTVNTPIISGAF